MEEGATLVSTSKPPTDVEQLANWACRADYSKLSADSVAQLPVHILDCVSCTLAALGAPPVNAMRSVIESMAGSGDCPLVGGGGSTLAYAVMWHTALVRYVDFMDNYLAAKETCHTADNFGAVLTAAAHGDASGKAFMTALAVGYTAQSRFTDHGTFMERGLDHTAQLPFSIGAAIGPLLGLSQEQIANGVAMAGSSGGAYDVIRSKPLSEWKGLASSQTALGTVNALLLAKAGVKGPLKVIEGRGGIDKLLGTPIEIDWSKQPYEGVTTSTIKKYNAMIHTQSSIECTLQLRAKHKIDPATIKSALAEVSQMTYDFSGGGAYGDSTVGINSKEQADHSLQYLIAVALIDGAVGPAQFDPARIGKDDVQQLLLKITAKPLDQFTQLYPGRMPARVTVETGDGKVTEEVQDFPGMPDRPFTWDEVVDKFGALTEGRLDKGLCDEIVAAVKAMETTSARDLLGLLHRAPTPDKPAFA